MPNVVHRTKLLIVDTSPSMAQVLKTFAELHNYDADVFSDAAEACAALANRFSSFAPGVSDGGYDCVVLGWPKEQVRLIADLLGALGTVDNSDLPLIVLSEEPDKDVQTLVRRRANTRTLLWRDHNNIESIVENTVVKEVRAVRSSQQQAGADQHPTHQNQERVSKSVLLVDDTPSVCHTLRDMLESNDYQVTTVHSVSDARSAVAKNQYDLVLVEFFLQDEGAEDLCRYLNSLHNEKRPVCVVMTRKIIDSVVQRSLAVGAITCLDKSESTEILFARFDAIAQGLSRRVQSGQVAHSNDETGHHSGLDRRMQMSATPTVIIDVKRTIVAANAEAARLLASGDEKALPNISFEKAIHGAPVKRSSDQPVKALFRNLAGESLSVVYRSRVINGAEHGLAGDVCMLTFESVDENKASTSLARTVAVNSGASNTSTAVTSQSVSNPAVSDAAKLPVTAAGEPAPEVKIVSLKTPSAVILNNRLMEQKIQRALDSEASGVTNSLLMLDIKMVAAVTGDRLSLGNSDPLLELVKTELANRYTRKDSIAYLNDGKFVLLFELGNARQAHTLAEKLVELVPMLIDGLSDIKLLSHAAFIELPRRSDISAQYILKHCAAACLKTEIEGLDNQIFDINANEKLAPRRAVVPRSVEAAAGVDLYSENAEVCNTRAVATS